MKITSQNSKYQGSRSSEYFEGLLRLIERHSAANINLGMLKWVVENADFYTPDDCISLKEAKPGYKRLIDRSAQKACFYNAQFNAIHDANLKYYEGFYLTDGLPIPIEHAFNVLPDGRVFDSTVLNNKITTYEWLGVHIPTKFISKMWLKSELSKACLTYYFRYLKKKGEIE